VQLSDLADSLGKTLARHGFPYSMGEFETLNHVGYGCPKCGASDRDRLYRLYFDKFVRPTPGLRVLEFAPSRAFSQYLADRDDIRLRTADLMMPGVDDVVDITDMKQQYPEGSFDFFICSHVLEHVDDDRKALRELHRILSPGGRGIVMTPVAPAGSYDEDVTVTDESERWRRFAQGDHVRLYDRATLVARMREAGFIVHQLGWRQLGPLAFRRHGIAMKSRLYVVVKPD
jgi:SAM-dependent methyltransferase